MRLSAVEVGIANVIRCLPWRRGGGSRGGGLVAGQPALSSEGLAQGVAG